MGCWNGTDFLGGLPLSEGEEIRAVIILNRNTIPDANGFCYANSGYATPISFMFKGVYNDYGGIDFDENQVSVKALRDMFKTNYDRMEIHYSSYDRDPEWTIEDFDKDGGMNKFINDYVERGRVKYLGRLYGSENDYNKLGFVMMSERVLTSLKGAFKLESYDKRDVKKDVEFFVEDVILNKSKDSEKFIIRDGWDTPDVRKTGRWDNSCRIFDDLNMVNTQHFRRYLDFFKSSDDIKASKDELIETIYDFFVLLYSLERLRISWRADSGKGSQDYGVDAKIAQIKGIIEQINTYYRGDKLLSLNIETINVDEEDEDEEDE